MSMTEAEARARNARANEKPADKKLVTKTYYDASNRPIIEHNFEPRGSGSKMAAWMGAYTSPTHLQLVMSGQPEWNRKLAGRMLDELQRAKKS